MACAHQEKAAFVKFAPWEGIKQLSHVSMQVCCSGCRRPFLRNMDIQAEREHEEATARATWRANKGAKEKRRTVNLAAKGADDTAVCAPVEDDETEEAFVERALKKLETEKFCKRCKRLKAICSLCGDVVKGLWVACQLCGHGGHSL